MQPAKIDWQAKIKEIEDYFNSVILPNEIQLDQATKIMDSKLFVSSHLSILKRYSGNEYFLQYLIRLLKLKKLIENGKVNNS